MAENFYNYYCCSKTASMKFLLDFYGSVLEHAFEKNKALLFRQGLKLCLVQELKTNNKI